MVKGIPTSDETASSGSILCTRAGMEELIILFINAISDNSFCCYNVNKCFYLNVNKAPL